MDADSSITKTLFNYEPQTGNLNWLKENHEITGKEITTSYGNYNGFGKPLSITKSAPGITDIVSNFTYCNKGRFVEKDSGILGDVLYAYDPIIGQTISVTGINGKTAYSYYDNWGVLEKSLSADSISTNYSTGWAEGNGPENALYYSYAQPEGQPWVKTWFDAKGRVLSEESIGFNNIGINTDYAYTPRNEVDLITTVMGGIVTAQVDYEYYDDGRLQSETHLGGKVVSYQYNGNTVGVTTDNKTYSKTYDKWGNVTNVEEPSPGGQITYTYNSNGKPTQIVAPSSTINMEYDSIGNQTMLADPDAGTIHYGYDALDRLIYQIDNEGNVDSVHYDYAGRIDYKKNNNEKTSYEYIVSGNGIGQLSKITAPNGSYDQYNYDEYGRTVKTTKHIDNSIEDIVFEYSYNEAGQIDTITYPENFKIINSYDNLGNLVSVKKGSTTIWELNLQTASKLKYSLGNDGMFTEKNFDSYGFMTSCSTKIGTNVIQYQYYDFNPVNSQLRSREDRRSNYMVKEEFDYDDLYRLTDWNITKNGESIISNNQAYKTDFSGNIDVKEHIGQYDYGTTYGPHAIETLATTPDGPVFNDQIITYTDFNKVDSINENDYLYTFTYGPDRQRIKSEVKENGTLRKTNYYGGLYEKVVISGGETRELLYIPAGDGLAAVYVKSTTTGDNLYYVHKDHLGSIVSVTNGNGGIIEQYNYDPWGRRRNPTTWDYLDVMAPTFITRGFSGHEHLDEINLINMNGRMYDPMLGMFLSPDNYLQVPGLSLNFNRYTYCLNNPLKYTDPSGELFDLFTEFINGFTKGLFSGRNPLKEGWNQATNQLKVIGGLFAADTKQAGWGWQIVSRLTWESPQTVFGLLSSDLSVSFGNIESVDYYAGATVLKSRYDNLFFNLGGLGITMGSYIIGANSIEANADNWLFQHEYGHYLQSRATGPAYVNRYAIPSLFGKKGDDKDDHDYNPVEQDANARAIQYFYKRNGEDFVWDFYYNPIGYPGTSWSMSDYNSTEFQSLLKSLILRPSAEDYIFPIINGFFNIGPNNADYVDYENIYYGPRGRY